MVANRLANGLSQPLLAVMLANTENRLVASLLRDARVAAITYEQVQGRAAESVSDLLESPDESTAVLARALGIARTELIIVGYDFHNYDYCFQAEALTGQVFSLQINGTERSAPCP